MQIRDLFNAGVEIVICLWRRTKTAPRRFTTRRQMNHWIIIGRDDGRFVDNSKHFFCWLHLHAPAHMAFTFVSEDANTIAELHQLGASAELFPGHGAKIALLRAGTVIVDNNHPFRRGYLDWLRGSRLVQLWHGAPLKQIELHVHRNRLQRLGSFKGMLATMQATLTNAYPRLDILISPSTFYTKHVFAECFNAARILEAGYSRNDCLLSPELELHKLVDVNVDNNARRRIIRHKQDGGRVILYAPTYRDDLRSPFDDGGIDLSIWANIAARNNVLLVLKLHPEMQGRTPSTADDAIVHIEPSSDVYPLLREVDLLISDYSSIHFDFLLLDRPVIFYAYDISLYTSESRPLLFDYDSMTPGPKANTFTQLMTLIQTTLDNDRNDTWKMERDRVRRMVFDHPDGHASERIWAALSKIDG